ncbi:MAG: DNA-binding transcriptional regulator [Alphaproteobacteria bacterium]|nr:MAG: DNA-binding transcriptional regulator [Alphaproteobacteria bacterium]
MRRADRLYRISEFLKARRTVVTADRLAREMEVSKRTIYRDVADLMASGAPIIGEAGVGYLFDQSYILKPLMFSVDEVEALVLGANMVESWSEEKLAASARSAIDKIASTLPAPLHRDMMETALFSPKIVKREEITIDFSALRQAIRGKRFIEFSYTRLDGQGSTRRVRPLALAFFGPVWLMAGWCESRQDFRNFRLDRMGDFQVTGQNFSDETGKRLQDFEEIMQKK